MLEGSQVPYTKGSPSHGRKDLNFVCVKMVQKKVRSFASDNGTVILPAINHFSPPRCLIARQYHPEYIPFFPVVAWLAEKQSLQDALALEFGALSHC